MSRAAYQTAVERYRGMGARRAEGIALTHLAGYVAREGEHQAAADLLDKADELLRDSGDVAFQSLVDIQRGQVEMACDRASAHLQDPNSDERPRRLAEARLLAASQAETFASRGGPRTLLSSSWGARLFSRLLRREIERRPSLCVWRGGRAFQVGDRSVMKLDQHPVSRRVLQALAEHRVQKPGHRTSDGTPPGVGVAWRKDYSGRSESTRSKRDSPIAARRPPRRAAANRRWLRD